MKRFLKALAIAAALALTTGVAYEQFSRHRDASTPHTGTRVDIGGRSLNINCIGQGGPVVIFNSGGSGTGSEWIPIQKEIAKFTRACWWDRAGMGGSDPGPFPATARVHAQDLRLLLQRANIPSPYVMIGGSFGGHICRVYNGLYPNDVAGMVLVDASSEDEYARAPALYRARRAPRWARYLIYLTQWSMEHVGVTRLMESRRPQEVTADLRTGLYADDSDQEARNSGELGDKPLIVLTAGKPPDMPSEFAAETAPYHDIWKHELQSKLARLSTRGKQVIVENATHNMGEEHPEVVVNAIREVVRTVHVVHE